MLSRKLAGVFLAASVGSVALMLPTGQASAFTLASPSLQQNLTHSSQIEKVYYRTRCWWRYGRRYCRRYWY